MERDDRNATDDRREAVKAGDMGGRMRTRSGTITKRDLVSSTALLLPWFHKTLDHCNNVVVLGFPVLSFCCPFPAQ
jgi:hypothetical protein